MVSPAPQPPPMPLLPLYMPNKRNIDDARREKGKIQQLILCG